MWILRLKIETHVFSGSYLLYSIFIQVTNIPYYAFSTMLHITIYLVTTFLPSHYVFHMYAELMQTILKGNKKLTITHLYNCKCLKYFVQP